MTDLNTVSLIGNITKDVELKYLKSGCAMAEFSIANNQTKKNANGEYEDEASFFNLVLYGKIAENLKKYLLKGQKIAITGLLKQQRWKDESGANHSRVIIIVQSITLLSSHKKENPQSNNFTPQTQADYQPMADNESFPEDIPF